MFHPDEARALVAAVRVAQPWLDPVLAEQAHNALGKVLSILPPQTRAAAQSLPVHAPPQGLDSQAQEHLYRLRVAAQLRERVKLRYRDSAERLSERTLHPLGCFHWGHVWTLAAWCETRAAFRSFRIDRMSQLVPTGQLFRDEAGKTLADFLRHVQAAPLESRG